MRYYDIQVTNPTTGKLVRQWTSFVNGQTDMGALDIELDIPVTAFAEPMGDTGGFLRVWGIPLTDIAQASNLNGMAIKVSAGMQKGLPLANPQQSGLIIQGYIFQAFGNWEDTNQTLDMQILSGLGTGAKQQNVVFNWKAGTSLADAISSTLKTAFPGYTVKININANLRSSIDQPGYYSNMVQFSRFIRDITTAIIGGSYQGVEIVLRQKEFNVFDGTTQGTPKQIAFNDLIGQPTWIGPGSKTIQFNCVLRADLVINDYIKMPDGQVTTTAQSLSQFRQGSAFKGTFWIKGIRHVGSFRQPQGQAWISTYNAFTVDGGPVGGQ